MKKSETENMLLVAYFYINLLPVIACTSKIRLGTLPGKQVDEVPQQNIVSYVSNLGMHS